MHRLERISIAALLFSIERANRACTADGATLTMRSNDLRFKWRQPNRAATLRQRLRRGILARSTADRHTNRRAAS
jgi:hypothetical protein